jgi:plasmid stabilization system protein ParE
VIPYTFHSEAAAEFAAAALRYESQQTALGNSFVDAVQRVISLIREYPDMGTPVGRSVRRAVVRRFPYAVIYRVESGAIFIIAIEDVRRSPGYWRHRE